MQEQAVFGYFFPRKKVTHRKGGRGQKSHPIKWISPNLQDQAPSPAASPPPIRENPKKGTIKAPDSPQKAKQEQPNAPQNPWKSLTGTLE
ncbi:hypothetical protein J3B00_000603 [Pseudomonas sp. BP8]|nr:hypothetical protein [Pseudomonas sp. BP8]